MRGAWGEELIIIKTSIIMRDLAPIAFMVKW